MTLYQQLQNSGNPQAAVQAVITLLESHTPQEVAKILGISPRWVYTLRKRYREGGCNLKACIRKRGPRNPMPNRTPLHLEHIVRELRTSEVAPHPQEEPADLHPPCNHTEYPLPLPGAVQEVPNRQWREEVPGEP